MITKLLALRLLACTQLRGAKSSPLVGVKVAVRCSKSSGERIKTNLPKKLSGERRAIFFGGRQSRRSGKMAKMSDSSEPVIYQLKVVLLGISPMIWGKSSEDTVGEFINPAFLCQVGYAGARIPDNFQQFANSRHECDRSPAPMKSRRFTTRVSLLPLSLIAATPENFTFSALPKYLEVLDEDWDEAIANWVF